VAAPFRFDRSWVFPADLDGVWEALTATDDYPRWWPWLRALDVDGFAPGATARCVIRGPLPYTLRCTVHVLDMVPRERVVSEISGDLHGPARLDLTGNGAGCSARLSWSLELRAAPLRRLAVVARPAMQWAHDYVVSSGVDSFRRQALDGRVP
jgi:uncharacterized protein YndB with AHSA1/START domain